MLSVSQCHTPLLLSVSLTMLLLSLNPAEGWYKQAAKARYYTVGRASGILLGVHRSPYTRRSLVPELPRVTLPELAVLSLTGHQSKNGGSYAHDPSTVGPTDLVRTSQSLTGDLPGSTLPVGRDLSGIKYVESRELGMQDESPHQGMGSMSLRVMDVVPDLQSCKALPSNTIIFICEARVYASLERRVWANGKI